MKINFYPKLLLAAAALVGTISPASAGTDAQAGSPPLNVVVLLADDWRHDTLAIAGHPVVQTPHLDKLAENGVRFTQGAVTTAICGVSRASILTGQWMSRHGNRGFKAFNTPWSETYPGILREAGYHIGHIGKWHCGPFPEEKFDFGRSYNGRHWIEDDQGNRIHVNRKNLVDAMEFFDTRPKDKPFVLNLCFFAPHAEDHNPKQYLPQEKSMQLYKDVTIPNPPLRSEQALKNLPHFLQDERNEGRVRYHWRFDTDESYQEMMKNYYRLCTEVDEVCGQVVERLSKEGILDNTLIIFIGDNGYFHGDRKLADKWYPYEESIRVPFIIRDPRMPAAIRGETNSQLALNVDLAPTILSATNTKTPNGMQGDDLSALYLPSKGQPKPWRQAFFYEHGTITSKHRIPTSHAVVTKDLKYTHWPEWDYEELYDLTTDPLEQTNLAQDPARAGQLLTLREKLKRLQAEAR